VLASPHVVATLYMQADCPHCAAKRADLVRRGVAFIEVNVSDHPEAIPELLKLTKGARLLPVVVEDGRIQIAPDGGASF
jgi:glutaredoxin